MINTGPPLHCKVALAAHLAEPVLQRQRHDPVTLPVQGVADAVRLQAVVALVVQQRHAGGQAGGVLQCTQGTTRSTVCGTAQCAQQVDSQMNAAPDCCASGCMPAPLS
jgi:hypothetical protein